METTYPFKMVIDNNHSRDASRFARGPNSLSYDFLCCTAILNFESTTFPRKQSKQDYLPE